MADQTFHPGAMVKCPVCSSEVHVSQAHADPKAPFRCDSCKRRGNDTLMRLQAQQAKGLLNVSEGKQPDHNVSDQPAPSRSARSRDKAVQRKPTESDGGPNDVDLSGNLGED